jgi:hypothetical protein
MMMLLMMMLMLMLMLLFAWTRETCLSFGLQWSWPTTASARTG